MKISQINVGDRARSSLGWLDELERSIEQIGVLQPIGVTPAGELIFGQRRLQACKNLGMEEIPVRVIDINPDDPAHLLKMEQAENNVRKDFTPSEKVEIARRIEEALAGRNHRPAKVGKGLPGFEPPKGKSSDIAAEAVGWSGETYRQAKRVVEDGDDETKSAMDAGELSVNAAYKKTRQPAPSKFLTVRVRLAHDMIEPEANAMVSAAGHELSTEFAMALLKACGHQVHT